MIRRQTRPVQVGPQVIGGGSPILIQSMTTTRPSDLKASLAQIAALTEAGCPLIRLAVPSVAEARALASLRREMDARGLRVPLVADVHFNPAAALEAARHVEKVRINPGNFAADPAAARAQLAPLLALLRDRGAALRIGVNHGSLAPYIADRYGHGPQGMVASALDYLHLCRELDFVSVVVALKASNPVVMVAANRLLVKQMTAEGMDTPIHLGVTEAGSGTAGALRSAVGIGTLLAAGIGDTIRVSLTGDPVREIEVCRRILAAVAGIAGSPGAEALEPGAAEAEAIRWAGLAVGGSSPPRVELALDGWSGPRAITDQIREATRREPAAESILVDFRADSPDARPESGVLLAALRSARAELPETIPLWADLPANLLQAAGVSPDPAALFAPLTGLRLSPPADEAAAAALKEALRRIGTGPKPPLLRWHHTWTEGAGLAARARGLIALARGAGLPEPCFSLAGRTLRTAGEALSSVAAPRRPLLAACVPPDRWQAAVSLGALLLDGRVDVLTVQQAAQGEVRVTLQDAYALLQATRRRMSGAEFISCPGCGRLAYDLEEVTRRVQARFGHLRGVKIAIMGCNVNGPGEMADADFGYVGAAPNKVDLYAGRRRVRQGLSASAAEQALVALLTARGLWVEPPGSP